MSLTVDNVVNWLFSQESESIKNDYKEVISDLILGILLENGKKENKIRQAAKVTNVATYNTSDAPSGAKVHEAFEFRDSRAQALFEQYAMREIYGPNYTYTVKTDKSSLEIRINSLINLINSSDYDFIRTVRRVKTVIEPMILFGSYKKEKIDS